MEPDRVELIEQILEAKLLNRSKVLSSFMPNDPEVRPFSSQAAYLRDPSLARLLRCGNRSAKSWSACRDLSWRITRTHPYDPKWNLWGCKTGWSKRMLTEEYDVKYLDSTPRILWMIGPTFEFVNSTLWSQYLKSMIPEWCVEDIKYTAAKNIDYIKFKNGDILRCKTYSQDNLSLMGMSLDYVYLDEFPSDLQIITELLVRVLDRDGGITLAFTPLVENQEIRIMLDNMCEEGSMSLHSWSFTENPLYRDNPERLARAMSAYANMPEEERAARISGAWYINRPMKSVFEGIEPEIVEDFPIPDHWRQARVVDPASHTTGIGIFAEDPSNGQWYCIDGDEFSWAGGKLATVTDIMNAIEAKKTHPRLRYCLSLYDNSEAWFGASSRHLGFQPCILKNRQEAIMHTRDALGNKRIKLFRIGAAKLIDQIKEYRYNADGINVVKKNDHVLDTLMYFSRQIPKPLKNYDEPVIDEHKEILTKHLASVEKRRVDKGNHSNKVNFLVRNLTTRRIR
jgi:hypothetical protein